MCGRFALTLPPEAVRACFRYVEQPNFPPRANIAPTQPVPVVRMERDPDGEKRRHFTLVRWAFLPGFVKDPKDFPLVINARSETVLGKPSFRAAMRRRRCIFIADAFYEWRRDSSVKGKEKASSQPFLIRRSDGAPMAIAGLWETWAGPNGEEVDGACVLTTPANQFISAIHDRMPVILEPEDFDRWLDSDAVSAEEALALCAAAGEDILEYCPIAPEVNKVANDDVSIQNPVGETVRGGARAPKRPAARQGDLFG
jgi:putative SOS response-associated peptidase YedK